MRWMVLPLFAIACSHSMPPPPPLAVPPHIAAQPAQPHSSALPAVPPPAPDGGVEMADLAAPITAAGVETPVGLDWTPEIAAQPASATFKNVKVLGAVSSARFMAAMQSLRADLGEKCDACHLVEQKDFASDEKKPKQRARDMIRMTDEIDTRTFGGKSRVTCWTCHRGELQPKTPPFPRDLHEPFARLSEEELEKPAEQVFKDVRELKGMKARQFGLLMGWFSSQLGVKCSHCHDEAGFEKDTPKKTRAREMLQMTSYVAADWYNTNDSPIGCGTCHRGNPEPPRTSRDLAATILPAEHP
jgi:Photosynthetic reaction centre cytochrome C subunit